MQQLEPSPQPPHRCSQQPPSPADSSPPPSPLPTTLLRPGQLTLAASTLDEFLALPQQPGNRYELVDGFLYHRPHKADRNYTTIQSVLSAVLHVANITKPRDQWLTAHAEAKVGVSVESPSAGSSSSAGSTCLIADIAVGTHLSREDEGRLSPRSQGMHFPPHNHPPLLVIEVTRSDRKKDITSNIPKYYRIGVPEYIVVDRQKKCVIVLKQICDPQDCGGEVPRISHRLAQGTGRSILYYRSERRYQGNDTIEATVLRDMNMTAKDMLDPPRSATEVILSPIRKAEAKAEASRKTLRQIQEREARRTAHEGTSSSSPQKKKKKS